MTVPTEACRRCDGPNIRWSAPSPLWNQVMRGGSINGQELYGDMVCPVCFVVLAEGAGVASGWRLYAAKVNVQLETVTPSGRVWDAEEWLWVDPPPKPEFEILEGGRVMMAYPGLTPEVMARAAEKAKKGWPAVASGWASDLSPVAMKGYDRAVGIVKLARMHAQGNAVRSMGASTPDEAQQAGAILAELDRMVAALEAAKEPR